MYYSNSYDLYIQQYCKMNAKFRGRKLLDLNLLIIIRQIRNIVLSSLWVLQRISHIGFNGKSTIPTVYQISIFSSYIFQQDLEEYKTLQDSQDFMIGEHQDQTRIFQHSRIMKNYTWFYNGQCCPRGSVRDKLAVNNS